MSIFDALLDMCGGHTCKYMLQPHVEAIDNKNGGRVVLEGGGKVKGWEKVELCRQRHTSPSVSKGESCCLNNFALNFLMQKYQG